MTLEAKAVILAVLAIGLALVFEIWPRARTLNGERRQRAPLIIMVSLAGVALALIAVGLVSGTVRTHLVQISPLVVLLVLHPRAPAATSVAAKAVLSWWLVTMAGIWLFLLGLSRFLTGRFSPTEVFLTLVIGGACLVGLSASTRVGTVPLTKTLPVLLFASGLQSLALWASYQPIIAGR